jgi:hypothetical protein
MKDKKKRQRRKALLSGNCFGYCASVNTNAGNKILGMYKVAGQRRVIAIVDMPSADDLDRTILGRMPFGEYLEFEAIWPRRPFESFLDDCRTHFGARAMKP